MVFVVKRYTYYTLLIVLSDFPPVLEIFKEIDAQKSGFIEMDLQQVHIIYILL